MQKTTLHGRELAYREAGAGEGKPTLLLIHGMAGSSGTWREMIPRLESSYHILAPDLPGHGESSLDFDDYSLDVVPEPASLAALSLGVGLLARRRRR